MISFKNIVLEFGGFRLLDDVSFLINKDDKLGLVGRNGAGKTTIMRLICGEMSPSFGSIDKQKGIDLGYLAQEKTFNEDNTVFKEAMLAFEQELVLRNKINDIQHKLENQEITDNDELLEAFSQLNELNEQYSFYDGANIEMKTERVLLGLGFERKELNNQISSFSEGWQMRVELAKILLRKTDILLLDEPTNHLDIESIQWLEDYLISYKGALVLISHDKMFLDNVTSRTIEVNFGKIYDYPVSYSDYVELRDERIELQKRQHSSQQREIDQIEKFVSKFRYKASKAKQVQSRVKLLDKIDTVEIDEINASEISFRFPDCRASGKIVLEAENINKSYGNKEVLKDLSFIIATGDKISFIGKNGQGKTTLSRIIADNLEFDGKLKNGYNVYLGYFPQNAGKTLDSTKTVLEVAESSAHEDFRNKVRSVLGNFLFSGDDVYKKVSVLSGGEKSRLALAILMCRPTNFLVLDEPTNHLDMLSKEVLKFALLKYKGTLVIVSHDREFLDGLTNQVYYFNNKMVKKMPGSVSEFLQIKKINDIKDLEKNNVVKSTVQKSNSNDRKNEWEQKKEFDREQRKLKNKLIQTEVEIGKLEKGIQELEVKLSDASAAADEKIFQTYAESKTKLEELLLEWERVSLEIETTSK